MTSSILARVPTGAPVELDDATLAKIEQMVTDAVTKATAKTPLDKIESAVALLGGSVLGIATTAGVFVLVFNNLNTVSDQRNYRA